ncbi:MAG TPA: hypothetical protein VIV40_10135, partial [Kofleriaceae bacterium]
MKRLLTLMLAALVACGGSSPKSTTPAKTDGTTTTTSTSPTPPVATSPDDAPLPLWPKLKRGTLPNGLTYYILPHKKPEKRALLWLA